MTSITPSGSHPRLHSRANSSLGPGRALAATLCGLFGLGLQLPAAAQLLPACDWYEAPVKLAYPETNARYYQADLPVQPPLGSRIRIEGEYLATRYFSFQVYDARFAPVDQLGDYKLVPDPGSQSTLLGPTASNPAVAPGGHYTAYVNYGLVRAVRPRNTLFTGASLLSPYRVRLALRTYLEEVQAPLPKLVLETPAGDMPLHVDACWPRTGGPEPAEPELLAPTPPAATTAAIVNPRVVPFAVFYGGQDGDSEFGLNQNAAYMSAAVTKRSDIVVIRGRAPTFRDRFVSTPALPEVRYWSFCQNDQVLTTVVACLADREIPVDAKGIYHLVIADGAVERLPKSSGYAAIPFGPVRDGKGYVIYRQLLAASDFVGAITKVPFGVAPADVIGDYAPTAAYCPPTLFEARVRARDTPDQIYNACAAAP